MKYLIAFIVAIVALLCKFATVALGFTNLDPTTAVFSITNMEPEYGNGGSAQFFIKLVRNTGYNFYYCTDILPHRRIYIDAQSFTSLQELTFDTDHNWTGAGIGVIVDPANAAYWDGAVYASRPCRALKLTTSYQEIYKKTGDLDFDIKYVGTAGFKIKNNINDTRSLTCLIVRGNIHVGA